MHSPMSDDIALSPLIGWAHAQIDPWYQGDLMQLDSPMIKLIASDAKERTLWETHLLQNEP